MTRPYNWKRNEEIYNLVKKAKQKKESIRALARSKGTSDTNLRRIYKLHKSKLRKGNKNEAV